jgi:hypothetical protein
LQAWTHQTLNYFQSSPPASIKNDPVEVGRRGRQRGAAAAAPACSEGSLLGWQSDVANGVSRSGQAWNQNRVSEVGEIVCGVECKQKTEARK